MRRSLSNMYASRTPSLFMARRFSSASCWVRCPTRFTRAVVVRGSTSRAPASATASSRFSVSRRTWAVATRYHTIALATTSTVTSRMNVTISLVRMRLRRSVMNACSYRKLPYVVFPVKTLEGSRKTDAARESVGTPRARRSVREGVDEHVGPHLQGRPAHVRRIPVHAGVLPAVAEVRVEGEEQDQAPVMVYPVAVRGPPRVLMDLGQARCHGEGGAVDGMVGRQLHEGLVGEQAGDLAPERGVDAEVVVGMEEPAVREVGAESDHFRVRQPDLPVAGQVEERVAVELGIGGRYHRLAVGGRKRELVADEFEQVGERRRISVPVAGTVA